MKNLVVKGPIYRMAGDFMSAFHNFAPEVIPRHSQKCYVNMCLILNDYGIIAIRNSRLSQQMYLRNINVEFSLINENR